MADWNDFCGQVYIAIRRLPLQESSRYRALILAMIRRVNSRTGVGW